ncbi:MAG: BrnA antitoxin family protein [Bacteroidota bacterium]
MKRYNKELTAEELAALPDSEIDYSDIPELGEALWANAKVVVPTETTRITIRVDRDVIDYFRGGGPGYQTRINAVLRSFVDARRGKDER